MLRPKIHGASKKKLVILAKAKNPSYNLLPPVFLNSLLSVNMPPILQLDLVQKEKLAVPI